LSGPAPLSLYHLLDPEVLADPYPLYRRLRTEAPVHWDPYLHAWVCTRYADVVEIFQRFSAECTPTPQRLEELGMESLRPIAEVMTRQMLFLDPPRHTRVRRLAAAAFTPHRVDGLRGMCQETTDRLLDAAPDSAQLDVMRDLANPLPVIITAELLGIPGDDHRMLKSWSSDFAEMLGNFQQNPGRTARVLQSTEEMVAYFRDAIRRTTTAGDERLVSAMATAEIDGDRLAEDEVIANLILTLVGAQETTANLIGNGLLTLLRRPDELERLRDHPQLMPSAIEELLRYESPSQYTARLAPADTELGGTVIKGGDGVVAVMGAANRDPQRFPDPDRLDLAREDNRHVAFGWAGHFCFGAPLARLQAQVAMSTLLRRYPAMRLGPGPIVWRRNLGLRGLVALHVLA
jgi:cytochrome P450